MVVEKTRLVIVIGIPDWMGENGALYLGCFLSSILMGKEGVIPGTEGCLVGLTARA